MADTLRNEFGVIPGVRVAADERTSRVIVQAPPEVQARISQRMAAAFPDLQPAPEKAPAGPVEVRQIPLKRIQADQLEAALWNTLGNRLTAMPEQRPGVARLSPGTVGRRDGRDLDRSGDQSGQAGRFRRGRRCSRPLDPGPRFAARPGGPECAADALATGPVGQRPAGRFDDANRQRCAGGHAPGGPAHATAARRPGSGRQSRSGSAPAARPELPRRPGPAAAKSRPISATFPGS